MVSNTKPFDLMRKATALLLLTCFWIVGSNGQTPVFEKYFYASTNSNEGFGLIEKPDGNFWTIGYSTSAVPSEPCGNSGIVIPMDSRGNPSTGFKIQHGVTTSFGNGIFTQDGNLLLVGRPMCLVKVDTLGNVLWSRFYRLDSVVGERMSGLSVTESGGHYYHAYQSYLDYRSAIIKTDVNGNTVWHKVLGKYPEITYIQRIAPDGAGGILVFANIRRPSGHYLQITRYNSDGSVAFARDYQIPSSCRGINMVQNSIGDLVMVATEAHTQTILGVDASGNVKWTTRVTMPGSVAKYVFNMTAGLDGSVAIVGKYGSIQYEQAFIYKLDSAGTYVWGRSFGTPGKSENAFNSVHSTQDCGYIATGRAEDSLSYYVHWVIKLDANGNCTYPGDSLPITSITYSPLLTGMTGTNQFLDDSLIIQPHLPTRVYAAVNQHNKTSGFSLATCTSISTDPEVNQDPVLIYPNPATERISISVPNDWSNWSFTLMDIHGRVIMADENLRDAQYEIDLPSSRFPQGIYLMSLRTATSCRTVPLEKL